MRLRGVKDEEEEEGNDEDEELGFKGRILGVDYSAQSIALALRLASTQADTSTIEFQTWDIMQTSPSPTVLNGSQIHGWDVVHDKGTFDAISLSDEIDPSGKRIVEGYKSRVLPLVKEDGLFVVTSCNWTEEELRGWFVTEEMKEEGEEEGRLEWMQGLRYRSFRFGGREGQTVCSVAFRKVG